MMEEKLDNVTHVDNATIVPSHSFVERRHSFVVFGENAGPAPNQMLRHLQIWRFPPPPRRLPHAEVCHHHCPLLPSLHLRAAEPL